MTSNLLLIFSCEPILAHNFTFCIQILMVSHNGMCVFIIHMSASDNYCLYSWKVWKTTFLLGLFEAASGLKFIFLGTNQKLLSPNVVCSHNNWFPRWYEFQKSSQSKSVRGLNIPTHTNYQLCDIRYVRSCLHYRSNMYLITTVE